VLSLLQTVFIVLAFSEAVDAVDLGEDALALKELHDSLPGVRAVFWLMTHYYLDL
jgi:hypothetical protein